MEESCHSQVVATVRRNPQSACPSQKGKVMKTRFSLFLGFVACLFLSMFYPASTAQNVKQRSIGRLPIDRNEPLRIKAVKTQGRPLRRNQKFDADGDWLKDLTVIIKNVTGKRILFASIDLFFRPPTGSAGPPAVDELDYGNRMLLIRSPDRRERLVGIEPEQTVEMRLSVVALDRIKSLLADVGYVEVSRLESENRHGYLFGRFKLVRWWKLSQRP